MPPSDSASYRFKAIHFCICFVLNLFLFCSSAKAETAPQVYFESKPVVGLPAMGKAKGDWLIPAFPIARELGSQITVVPDGSLIKITRAQDASTALYTPSTGELVVNGIPAGTYIPEVPLNVVPEFLALPPDLLAVLLGVSVQSGEERIDISRNMLKSSVVIQPHESWKDFGFDYLQTELGEYSLKLNPEVEGKPTHYSVVQNVFLGSGGHLGPLTFNGGARVQGGTGRNFLTFNSANLQVRHLRTGLKVYAGDNPLSWFQSKQLNGYPARGLLMTVPGRRWTLTRFDGLGFTQGIPVGGGTVRLSYERIMSISEIVWRPTERFRTSLATVGFYDRHPFILGAQQHGYYLQSLSAYETPKSSILGEFFVGEGKRTQLEKGASYLFDVIAKRNINRRLGVFAEYDRVSPHFSHPQIGNAFVDRSDAIVGGAATISSWLRASCNYSMNQSKLEARRPARIQVINASWNLNPFRNGPTINILGSQTFFRPTIEENPSLSKTLAAGYAVSFLNQPLSTLTSLLQRGIGSAKSKSTLGTISIDQKIGEYQLSGGATSSVICTQGQFKPTLSNSINTSIGRRVGRLGDVQVLSQIGVFTTRTSTHTFDIRALYKTPPIFGKTGLVFGPGYSRAGKFQRFSFIASLATSVPYMGSYSMSVNRQLAQTTSAAKYVRTVYLNKNRGRMGLDTAAEGRVPPFGGITGFVVESAEFPPRDLAKAPKLSFIRVILDGQEGIFREAGKDGKWSFDNIPVGRHRVSISVSSTPAAFTIVSPQTFYLQVLPGQTTQVNFALAKMGQIQGMLKGAENLTIERGQLGSVRVFLKEKDIDTLSDVQGAYALTDVAPGSYTVCVDEAYLPENLTADPKEKVVKLDSGASLANIDFTVKEKERSTTKRKL